jgi:hypothetical protein
MVPASFAMDGLPVCGRTMEKMDTTTINIA